jgi:predicted enzyme related to lactoylglutathione lyase
MPRLLINLDVPDIEAAIVFYTSGLGLRVGRRFDAAFVELLGAEVPLYLLSKSSATLPFEGASLTSGRHYGRHWTPVHLDFVVDDLDTALTRARTAGATLEGAISEHAYGSLALCSDPFGHGFCLLEFKGRGYDELAAR